ncbi:SIS domain-containing protein [Promicromonospora sp. Populi]|uniref:SIS domain-containing protein n=1 Tax=Promicromonospora sp. Populi TaxID=3239420 RepID=UPI0034E2A295
MSARRIDYRVAREGQPEALVRAAARVADQLAGLSGGALDTTGAGPLFLGMGASYAAAALPVRLLAAAGLPARREIASEVVPGGVGSARAVVGISQSGRSPETIAAVSAWPAERRWSLTNVAGSALAEVAGPRAVDLGSEPDSYASTIGYTGTLIGLTMLARATSGASVDAAHTEWHGISTAVRHLEEEAAPVIAAVADLATHPASGTPAIAADVVASGASRAASESGALLLREVCRIPSSAVVTRNYLHGEMESAGGTLHVVLGADREVRLARSLAAAGHPTLLLTSADVAAEGPLHVVRLPEATEPVRVVLETVLLQALAGTLADLRGVAIEDFVFEHDDTKVSEPVG